MLPEKNATLVGTKVVRRSVVNFSFADHNRGRVGYTIYLDCLKRRELPPSSHVPTTQTALMTRLLFTNLIAFFAMRGHVFADDSPSYQRHVTALFSKLGCNGGACHGAVKGQNGFRLSLFGGDPAGDRDRLVREFGGSRLNLYDPDSSLLLLKGTGRISHGGDARLRADSAEYEIIRKWIAGGAIADDPARSLVKELKVSPSEQVAKPGETYRLQVQAKFADDSY